MKIKPFLISLLTAAFLAAGLSSAASAAARIYRDSSGVPQIYADTNAELFEAYGYLVGKERLFQLEMRKRQAYGRTAEILGPGDQRWKTKYIEKDTEARQALNLASLTEQYKKLPEGDRNILIAFTAGLNKAITEALKEPDEKLPKTFKTYGFLPEEWEPIDVLVTASDILAYYSNYSFQLDNYALYVDLAKRYPKDCDDIFEQLLWKYDPLSITSAGDEAKSNELIKVEPAQKCAASTAMPNGLVKPKSLELSWDRPFDAERDEPRRASMAWAAGAARAKNAKSIFLNGPQTGWQNPSFYYTVGLHGGDFDFVGMAPEGLLPFQVGLNRHYAWGMTAGLGMQSDVFQEQVNDKNDTLYMHDGDWKEFALRKEVIPVKDQDAAVVIFKSSVHGPVIQEDPDNHVVYSKALAWRGHEAKSLFAWIHAAAAGSKKEWLKRADEFAFNYNWFYADKDGLVGFAFTGLFPARHKNEDIRLPVTGNGDYDYTQEPANLELVHLTDGTLFNFNNRPAASVQNTGLYWEQWSRGNQAEILKKELEKLQGPISWDDIWAINSVISFTDVNWYIMRPFILAAKDDLTKQSPAAEAADLILAWDGLRTDKDKDGFYDQAGQTLFDAWLKKIVQKTLNPTLDGMASGAYYVNYVLQPQPPRLEEHPSGGVLATYRALLAATGQANIPYYYDFFQGKNPLDIVREALVETVEETASKYSGKPMAEWKEKASTQRYFSSNANRIPITFPDGNIDSGLYANRGGINIEVEFGEDGTIRKAGFVNPLGGPENTGSRPSDYQLETYRNFELAPLLLPLEKEIGKEPFIELQ